MTDNVPLANSEQSTSVPGVPPEDAAPPEEPSSNARPGDNQTDVAMNGSSEGVGPSKESPVKPLKPLSKPI